jgi:hypothetical protein
MLLQTTMKQGGTRMPCLIQRSKFSRSARTVLPMPSAIRQGAQRIERSCLAPAFLRHFRPDVFPEFRKTGNSSPGMLSATGTLGSFTMPHSMASMSEKSLMVQGNKGTFGVTRAAEEEGSTGLWFAKTSAEARNGTVLVE